MIDDAIEDLFEYPFRNDWIGRIVIGSVLMFFGWLFLPIVVALGYYVRVMALTLSGDDDPPEFDNWGELLVDGAKAFLVWIAYVGVPLGVYGTILVFLFAGTLAFSGDAGAGAFFGVLFVLLFLLSIPLMIVISYVLPAAVANFAKQGRLLAAFEFSTLVQVWTNKQYFLAVVIGIAFAIAAGAVASFLQWTIVGLFLLPTLYFYTYLVLHRLWARGFGEAMEPSIETSESSRTPPV